MKLPKTIKALNVCNKKIESKDISEKIGGFIIGFFLALFISSLELEEE
jgi:hypothetical protein